MIRAYDIINVPVSGYHDKSLLRLHLYVMTDCKVLELRELVTATSKLVAKKKCSMEMMIITTLYIQLDANNTHNKSYCKNNKKAERCTKFSNLRE